jgi:IS605 OrfB family transposase
MWKLALQDAADTLHKYWQATFEKIRRYIFTNSSLSSVQKHYAYWLLSDYHRGFELFSFQIPNFKDLTFSERKKVVHYLNRIIRKHKGNAPKVKMARSFCLDADCYSLFTHNERQYISIMTLTPRQRLILPLLGHTPIIGNIRVVVDKSQVEIHYTADIKQEKKTSREVLALDFGYSEAFTDSEGSRYFTSFGKLMSGSSDVLKEKMQQRHKLHALHKKYSASNDKHKNIKAKRILKNNLGRQKFNETQRKYQATLYKEMNTACNQLLAQDFGVVVTEDLSHTFSFQKGKKWNRRLSSWVRGKLRERVEFKALVKGFDHKQVNAAYSSQTCLDCGYVGQSNRKGDRFQCQYCGYENDADLVAAVNLKSRYYDLEITRYMPYCEVKKILLARFHRRLETKQLGTVSGRILDTTYKVPAFGGQSESELRKHINVHV